MSTIALDHDYVSEGVVFVPDPGSLIETEVGLGQEVRSSSQITFIETTGWFSGMTRAPQDISDVIVNRLKEIPHVSAVLMGKSGGVYHVWTMIDDWTPAGRKAVYAAQRELLKKLKGFDLDFYVVALDQGVKPEDLVSEIPVMYRRAA